MPQSQRSRPTQRASTRFAGRRRSVGALAEAREAAFGRFLATDSRRRVRKSGGSPTSRQWPTTPFAPAGAATLGPAALEPLLLANGFAARIVVVNGRRSAVLSTAAAAGRSHAARTRAGRVPAARSGATPLVDLNAAFFEEALVLEMASNTIVTGPIDVLVVTVPGQTPALRSRRVSASSSVLTSEVTIVERYAGLGGQVALTNAVTEVHLGPNARADHVKVQGEPLSSFHLASLSSARNGRARSGRRSSRSAAASPATTSSAILDGEGAECTLNGLYIASGESLVDTHTTIDHAKPHCPSHELYKGILAGKSRAVFNGKIIVRQDAQKTNAKQTNKALLLTDDAQVNTKPQLEIFADDVKCTHGAAIGQLDDDALFYLRARGIDVDDARHMLIEAFAGEVLDGIRLPPSVSS